MTSHEYARRLRTVVDKLLAAESFDLPTYMESHLRRNGVVRIDFFGHKEEFLAAVCSVGSGKKSGNESTLDFIVDDLVLGVDRSSVCRIIKPAQPAEYECEPLLSQAEEASIG